MIAGICQPTGSGDQVRRARTPAIGGAGLLEAIDVARHASLTTPWSLLLAGAIVSFLVGWLSLWWLVSWIERGRLQHFAAWCIPIGCLVVALQLLR